MPPASTNRPPLPDPLAYLLTWTLYGTWLPGDKRGWVRRGRGEQPPSDTRERTTREQLPQAPKLLTVEQRQLAEETIRAHCKYRNWQLYAVNCRSNHVHVVVAAPKAPKVVLQQLKAWTARRLNELGPRREKWWTEHGSGRFLNCEKSLEAAVVYVLEAQDRKE